MTVDYKATIFLPRTDFPMRAGLPKREPEILARWAEMGLFARLREASAGREKFILHDGPPYANGHLHMGHALNKILKDVINRSQQMLGKDANYVPGWDCHGLPIEWKVEEGYRPRGQSKDEVPPVAVPPGMPRLRAVLDRGPDRGVPSASASIGDWENPYTTMTFAAEAQIVREIGKFVANGGLYAGAKPVLWSVVEKTALADAEVEYHDHVSPTVWVRFPLTQAPAGVPSDASVVIWTTTPWTLPATAPSPWTRTRPTRSSTVTAVDEGSGAVPGEKLLIARAARRPGLPQDARSSPIIGSRPSPARSCSALSPPIPCAGQGYDFDVPLLAADFVTMDQGTGFVHIAPGHGADDFELGRDNGLEVPRTVDGDGVFLAQVPLFAGTSTSIPRRARRATPTGRSSPP